MSVCRLLTKSILSGYLNFSVQLEFAYGRALGPGTWRIKTNEELDHSIKHNIINQIRAQRLSWFGHVQRTSDGRMVKKIYKWKPITTRLQGRPKSRWDDNVK
jgi:hypothetical protein